MKSCRSSGEWSGSHVPGHSGAFTCRCVGRVLSTVIGGWKLLLWPSSLKKTASLTPLIHLSSQAKTGMLLVLR